LNFCFRNGSVVVNFTLTFSSFDSHQFITIQDSIEVEKTIDKMILLNPQNDDNENNAYYTIGPNGLLIRCINFDLSLE